MSNHNFYAVRATTAKGLVINRFNPFTNDVIGEGESGGEERIPLQTLDVPLDLIYNVTLKGPSLSVFSLFFMSSSATLGGLETWWQEGGGLSGEDLYFLAT